MNKKLISKIICLVAILMVTLSGTAFANNGKNVHPSSQTTQITSTKSASLNAAVNPLSLIRPTTGTNLPYYGSFSGVNTEIFSNYYFNTKPATQFYVDWGVQAASATKWHINVYQAGTNNLVVSSPQYDTSVNTGSWTTRFYNLDSAYNYYISFKNDGPSDAISGLFTARLN